MVEETVLTPAERMLKSQAKAKIRAPIVGAQVGVKLVAVMDRVGLLESRFDAFESDADQDDGESESTTVLAEMQAQMNDILGQIEEIRLMLPSADAFEALCNRIDALEAKPEPVIPDVPDIDGLTERVELLEALPDSLGALEGRVLDQGKQIAEMAKPKRARKPRAEPVTAN